ncbi:MAG TPA: HD domain-containing phosphohydrolase [Candidatus Deferrimicrobiaceae bacterium]|jgi:putative nucleotidyltransferase with HDIG domain
MKVDVRQLILSVARAVDLVGIDDVMHGRRVAVIAVEIAKRMGWDRATQQLLFDAGLVHDCGVSSTRVHRTLVDELDWADAHLHCEKGYALLKDFPPMGHLAPIVLYHHTHWDELSKTRCDPMTALLANLVYLSDRVDVQAASCMGSESPLLAVAPIRETIARYRGTFFAPEIVDAFLTASAPEAFWLRLTQDYIPEYVAEMQQAESCRYVGYDELKRFALIIAEIVDAKSHFTKEHSLGVARLARRLAQMAGFTGERLGEIEVAALLHDIGKLQVPDEVLDSPAKLSTMERAVIMKHSYATWQILRRIGGLGEVARWASEHHESMSGHGYPFRIEGHEIPMESRIIKVADVYQALAQTRPYRRSLPAAEILTMLRGMEAENEVDGKLVDLVAANLAVCQDAAVGAPAAA